MSLDELKGQLPLAQNSLESIELDLEQLMALRDVNVIRVAAMRSRLTGLQQEDPSLPEQLNRRLALLQTPFIHEFIYEPPRSIFSETRVDSRA